MSLSTPSASGTCRSMNRFVLCAHSRRAVRLGTMRGFLWYSRRLAWATAGARGERQVPAGLLDACIGLAVPGRPIVVDEVGYIPFEAEAANLFFQLVSARYERASLIVTSNKPFGRWGEVFGDDIVAAAMIDRLVHHAEVVALKGDSYRLKDRDLGRVPAATTEES
jgi:hypothetical protein